MKGVSHIGSQIQDCKASFSNARSLFKKIDGLPTGPGWFHDILNVNVGGTDDDGKEIVEEVELFRRDPVQVIRELIGDPTFKDNIVYHPERIYCDESGTNRRYGEMWNGDWWYDTQVRRP